MSNSVDMPEAKSLTFVGAAADTADAFACRALRTLGVPVLPRLATVSVTDKCNCRCTICDIHKRPAHTELDTAGFEKLFADPAMSHCRVVRITGGEPFLREDLPQITQAALSLPSIRYVHITTNGGFPERTTDLINSLAKQHPGTLHVQVSLDALDDRHNTIRGISNALDNALATLNALAVLRKSLPFHFGINQTVLASTIDQMHPIDELASRLGAGHSIFPAARHHEGKSYNSATIGNTPLPFEPEIAFNDNTAQIFYSELAAIKNNAHHTQIRAHSPSAMLRDASEEYMAEGGRARMLENRRRTAPPCMAMFTHFRVSASGDIAACSVFADSPAGNLRDISFGKIWKSAAASALRKKIVRCPGCWIECDINPSAFFSGDIVLWMLRRAISDTSFRRTYFDPLIRSNKK